MKNCIKVILVLAALVIVSQTGYTQNNSNNKNNNVLIHYWHFNNLEDGILAPVESDFSLVESPEIRYQGFGGGYMDRVNDGTNINAEQNAIPGYALRVRNPSNLRDLIIELPTTGFENPVLSYAVKRTTNGQPLQTIYYSTEEDPEWTVFESNIEITTDYQLMEFDFSEIEEVNNNPYFTIKIVFGGSGITGTDGNNRFDNIKLIGEPKDGTNTPPYFTEYPGLQKIIVSKDFTMDLTQIIIDPDDDELNFSAISSDNNFIETEITDGVLSLNGLRPGDAVITISADDGINNSVSADFRVLVYPSAINIANNAFSFTEWSPEKEDFEYPDNMIFLQTNATDPDLDFPLLYPYFVPHDDYNDDDMHTIGFPYNNTRRTRINALGNDGISFINTGRDRDLGGALLAINTTDLNHGYISWTGGTVLLNERVYGLRLQYRIGTEGEFIDFLEDNEPIEYFPFYDGHFIEFKDIPMPQEILNQEYVQLLWKYYWYVGDSGPRAELRLDDIQVNQWLTNIEHATTKKLSVYPNPADNIVNIEFDNPVMVEFYNSVGQLVLKSNTKIIDVSGLSSGLYNLIIKNHDGSFIGSEKLIIK